MFCPNCNKETSCGCKSCEKLPHEHLQHILHGDLITCPYCKITDHSDQSLKKLYEKL